MKIIALKRTLAIITAFSLFCSFFALNFTAVADGAEKFQNLVLNGDFEDGLNHWTLLNGGTPAILEDEDNGSHVAEFEWVAARKVIGQTMEVKPNTKYIFSYKYKKFNPPSNDCPDAYVALLDRNNAVIDQRWLNFAAAGQWNTFTYAFNSGANDKVTIKIADQNQNTPGKAYFDDISLCESLDISATTNGGGSVMGVDAKKVINKGDTVKLVANPAEKYSFAGWYNGSAKVSDSAEYSFTAETNAVYTAKFDLVDGLKTNLMKNGDFEDGVNGWTVDNNAAAPELVKDAETGSTVALINKYVDSTSTRNIMNSAKFAVEKNTDYVLVFDYKRIAGNVYFAIINDSGAALASWTPNWDGTGSWTYCKDVKFNSGNNTSLRLRFADQLNCNNYIDNIKIYKKVDVNISTNGGGTVDGINEYTRLYYGKEVTLKATPENKYKFVGWYSGDTLVSEKAEYSHKTTENVTLTAKFNLNRETPNLITNGDFENGANGWEVIAGSLPEVAYDADVESNIALFDKYVDGSNRNVVCQKFAVEKNTDYIVSFDFKKKNTKDQVDAFISVLESDKSKSVKDWWLNYRDNDQWYNTTNIINSGNNTTLFFRIADVSGGSAYIDNVKIYKKINVSVQSSNEVFGKVTGNGYWGFGFEKKLTAAADGGEFVGWYQGEQLISNEAQHSFTFFEDCAITAKFVAKKGDVNGDGKINDEDIALTRRALLNMDNSVQYDVNGDGLINVCDLVKMKNLSIKA